MPHNPSRRALMLAMSSAALLAVTSRSAFAAQDPVKIGFAAQTEGPAISDGRSYTRGFRTALEYINSQGGILNGREVVGVEVSQGLTGESARSAALRLAQRDQVSALIGPMYSDAAAAGLGVAKRFNLPFAPDQGGMWLYEQNYPGTLGLSCNARARTLPQMRWMQQEGYKSTVLLLADIDYNRDVEQLVRSEWEAADSPVKLADVIYYPYGQTQLQGELTKAIGQNVDFIWSEDWSAPVGISIMKACKDLNFKGGLSVASAIDQRIVNDIPTDISEGVFSHMDYAPDPSVPENKAFIDAWQEKWGPDELPYRTEEVIYSQTVFLLKAMDKAGTAGDGTLDGLKRIQQAMREIEWVSPRGSKVELTEQGLGLFRTTPMTQIQNGRIQVIKNLEMTPNDYVDSLPTTWPA